MPHENPRRDCYATSPQAGGRDLGDVRRVDDRHSYELRDSIQGISEKMLAQTLRALVQDGLVWREVEPTTPPQVTYGLSEFGQEVSEPLTDLFNRITQRLPPRSPE
ncbi:helix-turn-helix domain-containing protein [Streptomyces sp. NPDC001793]|uniref:winged helix-turn-helix transcriptional regulator n=1 Tax=Streptomyces sp. NPDC001793 TaxID=3154657 RepID=UPI0033165B51